MPSPRAAASARMRLLERASEALIQLLDADFGDVNVGRHGARGLVATVSFPNRTETWVTPTEAPAAWQKTGPS